MQRFTLTVIISIVLMLSCEKGKDDNEFMIAMGTVCGWCGGSDSLVITEDKTSYEYNSPCDNNDLSRNGLTGKSEWDELIELLDMDKFQNININTCYVCVDGCDTWISVKSGSVTHEIRFGFEDSTAIMDIRPFVDKLDSIRTAFREI
jgi:hypothetical protein